MPAVAEAGHDAQFACKCLNIRINSKTCPHPPDTGDSDYESVFVGDSGIDVVHTHLTLRIRSRTVQTTIGDATELTRYTSLTCLICRTLVYRVYQVISPDIDAPEGPVAPTEEWAERELLKSLSGWVQVHKSCFTDGNINQIGSSHSVSRLFGVVLPPDLPVPPDTTVATPPSHPISVAPSQYLPALPPIFLPPPFTPTHPAFRHLASIASDESAKLRDETEAVLQEVIRQKVFEIEEAELKLRHEVELLWQNYRQNLSTLVPFAHGHRGSTVPNKPLPDTSVPTSPNAGSVTQVSAVRVNEFVPANKLPRRPSPSTLSHQSALSTSLATSSLHYPGTVGSSHGSPTSGSAIQPPSNGRSTSLSASSPVTASSKTLVVTADGATNIREAYRRNMNESVDIATSFKYVTDMETEIFERGRARERGSGLDVQPPVQDTRPAPRGRSPQTSKSAIKRAKEIGTSTSPAERSPSRDAITTPPPNKARRKVTFDVKPDVAIISVDGPVHKVPDTRREQEAVFEMEGERDSVASSVSTPQLSMPTPPFEPLRTSARHHRSRPANPSGLPASLSALRPTSLPVPSMMRAPVPHEPFDERPRSEVVREFLLKAASNTWGMEEYHEISNPNEEPANFREAEILRLVAANTPSHRSAWKRDGKSWREFVSRQALNNHDALTEDEDPAISSNYARGGYYDESEDDTSGPEDEINHRTGGQVSHSLPIAMNPLSEGPQTFELPPLQPKASLPDQPGILIPPLQNVSSEAFKRASYAVRDRVRSIDPGVLDFTPDEEEDDGDDLVVNDDIGGKGRQRALKILEARNKVPSEGMWRSLA